MMLKNVTGEKKKTSSKDSFAMLYLTQTRVIA